jgi:hypothetical protein
MYQPLFNTGESLRHPVQYEVGSFFQTVPSVANNKIQKGFRRLIAIFHYVELFLLILLVSKLSYFFQEMMVVEPKYCALFDIL